MKISVIGLGAVGGHFATKLAAAGHQVSAVCRGPVLDALQSAPLCVQTTHGNIEARVLASDSSENFGPQDVVILTAKANALPSLTPMITPLLGTDTLVVFAQNGIPWWYASGLPAGLSAVPDLAFLDPQQSAHRTVPIERVVGGVIHSTNEMIAPGVVHNPSATNQLLLGMSDNREDAQLTRLRDALTLAGVDSPVVPDIRLAIWRKALLNMTTSIVCLLTGRRLSELNDDPGLKTLVLRAHAEALSIATAHGIDTGAMNTVATFLNKAPAHLPSIRQDFERGRPLELDALVLAPQRFARLLELDTPCLDTIAALAVRKARDADLYVDMLD